MGGNLAFAGGRGGQISAGFNSVEGDYTGFQLSTTANRAAAKLRGFQAAAGINLSERLSGAQVGLINIARNKRSFSVLPILNYHR